MTSPRVVRIEWARLEGRRPRSAGCNARLGEHGAMVRLPLARITTDDGSSGFGFCRAAADQARLLLGQPLDALFDTRCGVKSQVLPFDYPLWDLTAKRAGLPVYRLAATMVAATPPEPLRVPCYDTSLYMDDLHIAGDDDAGALIAEEARQGWQRGHRAFKIKVGRGARHMALEAGTRRDVAVVHAVREAVGAAAPLMLDANNGYNLNLAKRVLVETAACRICWLEEAFHEDAVLYADLAEWIKARGLSVLIADGEGQASPSLLDWARDGLIHVVQYDIFGYGFTSWLELGRRLASWRVRSAPHHYGTGYGNYAACHLAPAITGFTFVEWDEATIPALDASGYSIAAGHVNVPPVPGFGLALDDDQFLSAVQADGYVLSS